MSREFNYKRAWQEWAWPHFFALPPELFKLLFFLEKRADTLKQRGANRVEFPKDVTDLYDAFKTVDLDVLQRAGKIVHNTGHWASPENGVAWLQKNGLYWKFEHLCDAYLIGNNKAPSKVWEDANFHIDTFMDHKPGTAYDHEEVLLLIGPLVNPEFCAMKVDNVNYRIVDAQGKTDTSVAGHPFVIGTQHFPKDGGMYIKPEQAPCAHCKIDYKYHTHDVVAMLRPWRNLGNAEATAALRRVTDFVETHNKANPKDVVRLDGFVLLDTPEKFRIADAV